MPDKSEKGWRKKIHAARPKTPLQSKPAATAADEDPNERRRRQPPDKPDKPGWRKTIHGARPETPLGAGTSTPNPDPVDEELEDTRSEHGSETSTSTSTTRRRGAPRPTMAHYLSNFLTLTQKEQPIFSEPWNEDVPTALVPRVSNPHALLQNVCTRSHLSGTLLT